MAAAPALQGAGQQRYQITYVQELIDSARLKSQMTQLQSYKTTGSIFRDRFSSVPGDDVSAATRLGGAADGGFTIADGDGNGLIETNGDEDQQYWAHLLEANLISGLGGDTYALGQMLPEGKIGGAVNAVSVAAMAIPGIGCVSAPRTMRAVQQARCWLRLMLESLIPSSTMVLRNPATSRPPVTTASPVTRYLHQRRQSVCVLLR